MIGFAVRIHEEREGSTGEHHLEIREDSIGVHADFDLCDGGKTFSAGDQARGEAHQHRVLSRVESEQPLIGQRDAPAAAREQKGRSADRQDEASEDPLL